MIEKNKNTCGQPKLILLMIHNRPKKFETMENLGLRLCYCCNMHADAYARM